MNQTLNPLTLPLTGTSLIEASAGTGKTFNIAALFTRLVLLEQLPLNTILVVTFTKAATAELKHRLRARLNQALALLQHTLPAEKADPVLQQLIAAAREKENDTGLILRLQAAITEFDGAAIYTIHAFCQRVLSDYAFWCQVPFETETTHTETALLYRFAEDFWRSHVNHHPRMAKLVLSQQLTPQKLMTELQHYSSRTDLSLRQPETSTAEWHTCEQQLFELWPKLCQQMPDLAATFWRIHPQLNQTSFKQKTFSTLFGELTQAATTDQPLTPLTKAEKLQQFQADILTAKCKKGQVLCPEDINTLAILAEFGQLRLAIEKAQQQALLQLQLDCFTYVRQQLAEHRRNSHERSFDDLLTDLDYALSEQNPHAQTLARALAQTWHIALVDECQDTDPLQYRLFKTIFADQNRPLLMVGDPKQAIYRFRGADIHAYLRAANDTPAGQRYTLQTNYRSHQALVQSVNHLFSQRQHPFILEGIDFPKVESSQPHSQLTPAQSAITIRWLHEPTDSTESVPNKNLLRQRAAQCCANEIASLIQRGLNQQLHINQRPLQAGDIAVLVHTHNEGQLMARTLKKNGVISVSLNNQSVFASSEAQAMTALLHFWLQPQHTHYLRFILAGPLYHWTAEQLNDLNQNETAISQWIQTAINAHERWQQQGIYSALQWFATQTRLETIALKHHNQRSLTNFWQLAELLADAAQTFSTTHALVQWFDHTLTDPDSHNEAHQLRLESDEALVKIVTMHAAKGLEYPIVFCPFVWDGKNPIPPTQNWFAIHRSEGLELVAKSLLTQADKDEFILEAMSEKLRLYYVAFTRAREQLIIYAAAGSELSHNPFTWLLDNQHPAWPQHHNYWQQAAKKNAADLLKTLWQNCLTNAHKACHFAWQEGSEATATLTNPYPATQQHYQALSWPPRRFSQPYYTSFTHLSRSRNPHQPSHELEEEAAAPALDQAELSTLPASRSHELPETELLQFARGIQAGLCLHAVLEQTEFSQPPQPDDANHIAALLARFGFDPNHTDTLLQLCDQVRQCRLSENTPIQSIPPTQRLAEMNFMLHMHDFNLATLQQWFAQPHLGLPQICIDAAAELNFNIIEGFINGAIDLVGEDTQGHVYVVDYKSNHLGNRLIDYHQNAMDQAMAQHHYYLQALIYTIAVARFLQNQQRLPEKISVRYLFLRGLNSTDQSGIWSWDIATTDLAPWLTKHDKKQ
ncbi:exodeoxyribonuclease V subunit beta [Neisseriaceae bacterium ESL0693]|nr:exodeoxyribonuclease V subunit beta [Neisseriaceae bacterium ESL0693]